MRRISLSFLILAVAVAIVCCGAGADDLGNRSARMWEAVEISLPNTTWSANPFDLVASVTFTHSNERRTTEMFFAGDNVTSQ